MFPPPNYSSLISLAYPFCVLYPSYYHFFFTSLFHCTPSLFILVLLTRTHFESTPISSQIAPTPYHCHTLAKPLSLPHLTNKTPERNFDLNLWHEYLLHSYFHIIDYQPSLHFNSLHSSAWFWSRTVIIIKYLFVINFQNNTCFN